MDIENLITEALKPRSKAILKMSTVRVTVGYKSQFTSYKLKHTSIRSKPKADDEGERTLAHCFGAARKVRGKEFFSLILPFLKLNDIGL